MGAVWQARSGCTAMLASHPALERRTHAVFRVLSVASIGLPLPLAPFAPTPDAVAECATIITFMQACALTLPLLFEARAAARLFVGHQAQRAAAELPPERGTHATAYEAIWEWCCGYTALPTALLAWAAVAAAWDWSAFLHAHASSTSKAGRS